MAIQIGQQPGSLEITALLGKGGMGQVYRARDTKLKRDVAIKILPDEFARDADRVARFQREAEVLASLSHPNIAGIYDLQHSGDMITTVATWLCKCGVRIKGVGETDGSKPTTKAVAACPNCGDKQDIYAHRIISVTCEKAKGQLH
jgi:serine/threonine protein kinase